MSAHYHDDTIRLCAFGK